LRRGKMIIRFIRHAKVILLPISLIFLFSYVGPSRTFAAEAAQLIIINPVTIGSALIIPQVTILDNKETKPENASITISGSGGIIGLVAVSARD
jgi:hypothetical protein